MPDRDRKRERKGRARGLEMRALISRACAWALSVPCGALWLLIEGIKGITFNPFHRDYVGDANLTVM